MKLLSLLLLLSLSIPSYSQQQSSSAWDILNKTLLKHGTVSDTYQVSCLGRYQDDSHLKDPNVLNTYEYTQVVRASPTQGLYNIDQKFTNDKGQQYEFKSIVSEDSEYSFNSQTNSYRKTPETNLMSNLIRFYAFDPALLFDYIIRNQDKFTAEIISQSDSYYTLSLALPNDEIWFMEIQTTYIVKSMYRPYFHNFYGDVKESITWSAYLETPEGLFPEKVSLFDKNFETYNFTLKRTLNLKDTVFESVPTNWTEDTDSEESSSSFLITKENILLSKIDDGLYSIDLPETNNRLLLAEFSDFLFLFEGAYNSMNGDLLLDFLRDKFPSKGVKYWSFSHCHGQYIGFARSMAANGTKIITTSDNKTFIEKLCLASFESSPDKQSRLNKTPNFDLLEKEWKLNDPENEVEIYNIASDHTLNYKIFYFPKHRICFVGDLLWVKTQAGEPIKGRSATFYNEVTKRLALEIDTFYISWPLNGYPIKTIVGSEEIITN